MLRPTLPSLILALLALGITACSGQTAPPPTSAPVPSASGSSASQSPQPTATAGPLRPVDRPTLWLCRPGMADNPCEGGLDATVVRADGATSRQPFVPAVDPPVDCFYVYPTVSDASTPNAPRRVTPQEVRAVRAQAARFTAACRLFAPVYRQITRAGLTSGALRSRTARDLAYSDVLSAFNDYLNTDNGGRPFVLLGHSQGATNLIRLVQEQIDGNGALRERMQSALLLGASVLVPPGREVGGSFARVPACTAPTQRSCVVSYATYEGVPPSTGIFGRASPLGRSLCVDPAALLGNGSRLAPYFPTTALVGDPPRTSPAPRTGFVTYPDAVTGRCRANVGFDWLDVEVASGEKGSPPRYESDLGPAWGTHVLDVTLALGDLVELVRVQSGQAPR